MDLRVQRTRKLLWDALLGLLGDKPFEQVQVDELCQRAMVHRTTFYKHYRDKHDLAARGAKAMLQAVTRELARSPTETTGQVLQGAPDPQITATLAHVAANPAFYRLAFSQDTALPFRAVLERFLAERVSLRLAQLPRATTPPPVPDVVITAFTTGAVVSLLGWWVNDGFKVSQETMADYVTVLVAHGAYPAAGLVPARAARDHQPPHDFAGALTDRGVRAAAGKLGLPTTRAALTARAAAWQPWRAYAMQYLWAAGDHAISRVPA